MSYNYIEKFKRAINTVKNSPLVMADDAIRSLLALIAEEPSLYSIIQDAAKTFDYRELLDESVFSGEFKMPAYKGQVLILITGLLYDFDSKELSLTEFITHFFKSETSNQSYSKFIKNIIIPFEEAILSIVDERDDKVEPNDPLDINKECGLPFNAKEDAAYCLGELLDIIHADNQILSETRNTYIVLVKGLMYVFEQDNTVLIKIVWTGLKGTMANYQKGISEINQTEAILKSYGVI